MEPLLIKNAAERGAIVSFNTEYLSTTQDADGRDGAVPRRAHRPAVRAARPLPAGVRRRPVPGRRADRPAVRGRARPGRHRVHPVQRRPEPVRRAPAEHPALDLQLAGRLRRDRHGPAARHPARGTEWIAGWGFDMAAGEPDLSDDVVLEKIRTLVGDPDLEVEHGAQVALVRQPAARHQLLRSGGCFCGGDAVHRHPPRSGLGSNTSMQDAFNLAWKVAFVVKGHAGPGLLDSYTPERAPVGQADRRPGQPVPQGLRRPAGVVRPRQRRPGRAPGWPSSRRPARRASRCASGSTRRWS